MPRFVPLIYGMTNNGKTTVSNKILAPFNAENYFVSAQSTTRLMQKKLQTTFSRIVLIDDFPPSMPNHEKIEKIEGIIRVCGDANGQRQTCNDLNGVSPISTMAVITAEDFYVESPSSIARTLPLYIKPGECDFAAVNALPDSVIPNFWYKFIKAYIEENMYSEFEHSFEEYRYDLSSKYTSILPRILDNHAVVLSAWRLVSQWLKAALPECSSEIDTLTTDLRSFLMESTAIQQQLISLKDIALAFLQELKILLDSGTASVVKLFSDDQHHLVTPDNSSLNVLQYGPFIYLHISYEEKIRAALATAYNLPCGKTKLRQALENKGILIKGSSSKYLSTRVTVNGGTYSFLKLNRVAVEKIFQDFE